MYQEKPALACRLMLTIARAAKAAADAKLQLLRVDDVQIDNRKLKKELKQKEEELQDARTRLGQEDAVFEALRELDNG
jgi:hypothetical protein